MAKLKQMGETYSIHIASDDNHYYIFPLNNNKFIVVNIFSEHPICFEEDMFIGVLSRRELIALLVKELKTATIVKCRDEIGRMIINDVLNKLHNVKEVNSVTDLERLKRIHKDMLKFFYEHRLFTTKEFVEFCKRRWNVSRITSQRWLKEHVEEGIIVKVKNGLYKVPEEIVAKLEMLVEEADSDG